MSDGLRQNNELPLSEPFTELGFNHVGGGGEITTLEVFDDFGNPCWQEIYCQKK